MNLQRLATATLVSVLLTSVAMAQCNRGGSNTSPSAGNPGIISQFTQSGANPYASGYANFQAQRALIQQRAMLAQQQAYRQALARRQRQNSSQLARQRRSPSSATIASSSSRTSNTPRQVRLREQNAERAFAMAVKAEANGRASTAEKYYRRAIRIAGEHAELGERAEEAIAALSSDQPGEEKSTLTALASLEL